MEVNQALWEGLLPKVICMLELVLQLVNQLEVDFHMEQHQLEDRYLALLQLLEEVHSKVGHLLVSQV